MELSERVAHPAFRRAERDARFMAEFQERFGYAVVVVAEDFAFVDDSCR